MIKATDVMKFSKAVDAVKEMGFRVDTSGSNGKGKAVVSIATLCGSKSVRFTMQTCKPVRGADMLRHIRSLMAQAREAVPA